MILSGAATFAGCASAPRTEPAIVPTPPAPTPLDASYDWHALVAAPFGAKLQEVPLSLHEVLLFHDDTRGPPTGEDGDCYAIDGFTPRFLARTPAEYTLCFKHDRLSRIEAMVQLPTQQAPQILSDACDLWIKNAGMPPSGVLVEKTCSGNDAETTFAAHLEGDADQAEVPLIIQLDAIDRS